MKPSPSNKENHSFTPLATERPSSLTATSQLPRSRPKEVAQLQTQLNALEKQHERLTLSHDHSMAEYAKLSQEAATLRRDLEAQRTAASRLGKAKADLEKALAEGKAYSRKLEAKIASGLKGNQIAQIQNSLEDQITDLRRENKEQSEYIQQLEIDNNQLRGDLEKALEVVEVKAEEFGLTGDLRSSLLYQYSEQKQALHSALASNASQATLLSQLETELSTALTNVEELKLIREENNDELSELEATVIQLNCQKVELLGTIKSLSDEKVDLLGTIERLHEDLCASQEREKAEQHEESYEANMALISDLQEQLANSQSDFEDVNVKAEVGAM